MPSPHETGGSICYPAHDNVPMAIEGDAISIHTTAEMDKYESLRHREFAHTRIYDVNVLQMVGNGRRASPHPQNYRLGKTLRRGSDDSSERWMTLQPCKWQCKHPSTHELAWCTTSPVTSRLTLMLKSCKDLSLGEVPGS
jgi:hypothetical protein